MSAMTILPPAMAAQARVISGAAKILQPRFTRRLETSSINEPVVWAMPLTDRSLNTDLKKAPLHSDLIDAILRVEGMFDPTRVGMFGRSLHMEVRAGTASMNNVFADRWTTAVDDPNIHYRARYLASVWLNPPTLRCDALKRFRPDDSTIVFDSISDHDCAALLRKHFRPFAGSVPVAAAALSLPVFAAPYAGGRLSPEDLQRALRARASAAYQRLLLKTHPIPSSRSASAVSVSP